MRLDMDRLLSRVYVGMRACMLRVLHACARAACVRASCAPRIKGPRQKTERDGRRARQNPGAAQGGRSDVTPSRPTDGREAAQTLPEGNRQRGRVASSVSSGSLDWGFSLTAAAPRDRGRRDACHGRDATLPPRHHHFSPRAPMMEARHRVTRPHATSGLGPPSISFAVQLPKAGHPWTAN